MPRRLPGATAKADQLLRTSPGYLVFHEKVELATQELTAELGGQKICRSARHQRPRRLLAQAQDDDLGPQALEELALAQRLDLEVGFVPIEDQSIGLLPRHGTANLEFLSQAPEAQETDSILALGHLNRSIRARSRPTSATFLLSRWHRGHRKCVTPWLAVAVAGR